MNFDGFVQALMEIAARKYRDTMSDADAFRELVTKVCAWGLAPAVATLCLLAMGCAVFTAARAVLLCSVHQYFIPLKHRIGFMSGAGGSLTGSTIGGSVIDMEDNRGFLDRLCQPDVVGFFNEYKDSLNALFLRYAMDDAPTAGSA